MILFLSHALGLTDSTMLPLRRRGPSKSMLPVTLRLPFTSNFAVGVVVPMPTLPPLKKELPVAMTFTAIAGAVAPLYIVRVPV